MEKLFSFDVTLKNLDSFRSDFEKTEFILDFLKTFWMENSGGNSPEYWDKIRIGTVDVYLDDKNHLHLDFVTRFHLNNYPEVIELLKQLKENNTYDEKIFSNCM